MMNLMRKIALISLLLLVVLLGRESSEEHFEVAVPTLGAQPVEPSWEVVRHHTHLAPPSTLEAPAPTVRLLSRTSGKQHASRHSASGGAWTTKTHLQTRQIVGGQHCPMAATTLAPHRAFVRLCRWII